MLSGIPSLPEKSCTTIADLMRVHFDQNSWPSTPAVILRVQQGPGDVLSWTDIDVPGKADCERVLRLEHVSFFSET